ncbi:lytic transglycosylase domain-containing protein [Lysinibacillus piscis]|uniref:Murein lytic transglycosylase YjbJ n=1 Tax=Lysinibacillus piscis TaxID=2518931 RepID=A0ABQ5NHA6_9BACI|nr:lytic transglycosylase domain-containing protein [Lysinibacillus sp. KH24]GLC87736.1 putative murein lytic transglycosylase YjbJ [Lysinibacillus sp. KH24]
MDIKSLSTLLDIQSLQSLGSVDSSSDNSLFAELIDDLLNGTDSNQLRGMNTTATNGAETPLQSLLYNGANPVFIPASVQAALASKKLDSYVADDVIGSKAYASSLAGANQYTAIIDKAAATYNVPSKLIAAVMKQESNFNPSVVSHAGAQGLMQLMPKTAQYLGVTNSFDPEQNIMAGAKYLRQMLDKFNNDPELALAAYNAGSSRVQKYGGIPPFKETQNYVKKVMDYFTL